MSVAYKMGYVEAPNDAVEEISRPYVFLGGGISNCPNWQTEVHDKLSMLLANGTIINPRRAKFDELSKENERLQVGWEHSWLWRADILTFWFCKETLCPITLHELGAQLGRAKIARMSSKEFKSGDLTITHNIVVPQLIVGIEPGYQRADNVELQIDHACPGVVPIVRSIDQMVGTIHEQIKDYNRRNVRGW